ncbi:MAG TPA: RNA-binding protein [Chloroflexi bacterium]|jgi:cold-inducible RNA-binding protein|nr:RNA-binding protein [Chloroflexota bacterium]
MRIYVGNLSYAMSEEELRQVFEDYGQVESATIIMDRDTGQSKGFGFVEMPTESEAQAAIAELNGRQIGGRALTVNEARPRPERSDRGGPRGGREMRGGGGGRRF